MGFREILVYDFGMRYIIEGPNVAYGTVRVSGAKNFSIKALVASVLNLGVTEYHNLPNNSDVERTLNMLRYLGAKISQNGEVCNVDTSQIRNVLDDDSNANMVIFLIGAALIHRFDFVKIPKNKGCPLGMRLDDFHIMIFNEFGISCAEKEGYYVLEKSRDLQGAKIVFPYPSVGATETAIFMGIYANGVTVIDNAAIEPEICALITQLVAIGACIYFESDRRIVIHGIKPFSGNSRVEIHGDLLEAATWGVMAAVTDGEITVTGVIPEQIGSFLGIFNLMGGRIERVGQDSIKFSKNHAHKRKNVLLESGVFPALRTDLQPLLATMATQSENITMIHETVYDNRVDYIESFKKFGAVATGFTDCFGNECRFHDKYVHSILVQKGQELRAPTEALKALTIRNGMAEIILASAAIGTTVIEKVEIIERGYCGLFNKLSGLGIKITKSE